MSAIEQEAAGCHFLGAFTVPGKCKSKSNFKPRRNYLSPELRAFEDAVNLLARARIKPKQAYKAGWVEIHLHSKTRTHIDLSNAPKSILDALVNAGIFEDDKDVAVTVPFATIGKEDKTVIKVWGKA